MEARTEILTRSRRIVPILLRLMIGLILLAGILALIDIRRVVEALSNARFPLLLLGIFISLANIASQVAKWKYLLSLVHREVSWKLSAMSVLFGNSLGVLTPGHLGEFVGRALRIQHRSPLLIAGMALLDRFQNLLVFTLGAAIALPAFSFLSFQTSIVLASTVGALLLIGATAGVRFARYFLLSQQRTPWLRQAGNALALLGTRQWIISIGYSIVFYAIVHLQMYVFLNAFEPVSILTAAGGFAMTVFVKSLLPISFGDLGVREASSVYFYSLLAVGAPTAFNAAFLMFLVNIIFPSIVGVLLTPRFNLGRSKQSATELP